MDRTVQHKFRHTIIIISTIVSCSCCSRRLVYSIPNFIFFLRKMHHDSLVLLKYTLLYFERELKIPTLYI